MTTIALATVVVTLGVRCVAPTGVVWPFSTSIGFAMSTLAKLWIPPTAPPVEADNVQV